MPSDSRSILVLGESNVGKTHYGAQLLKRLIVGGGELCMAGAATNLEPFETAMANLAEGKASEHTPAGTYVESVWPIQDRSGHAARIIWPDYGGEQLSDLVTERKISGLWRDRVLDATDWILLVRLHVMHGDDDVFTRPIASLGAAQVEGAGSALSDQARLVELLQMLLQIGGLDRDVRRSAPSFTVLLSCWDEMKIEGVPAEVMWARLPLLTAFIASTWAKPVFFGLSALEQALNTQTGNRDYVVQGPESFGLVVLPDGTRSSDVTLPIQRLLTPAVTG